MAIKCPQCGSTRTMAAETRETTCGRVRRRRKCENCGNRFTTYEAYIDELTEEEQTAVFTKWTRDPKKV